MGVDVEKSLHMQQCNVENNTRTNLIRWFKTTQAEHLQDEEGKFAEWFHGIITRGDAEELLRDKPVGCFLIRVAKSHFGYTLTFKSEEKIRHYRIDLTMDYNFNIIGEPEIHRTLQELVHFYQTHQLSNWDHTLTVSCGQIEGQCDYSELIEEDA